MKKLISAVISAIIILSLAVMPAYADGYIEPTEIFAGVKTLTLKYNETVNEGNKGQIAVSDMNGNSLELTPYYEGNVLTLSFPERIDITKDYVLTVNEDKYVFGYSVIWEADVKNSGLTKIKANKGNSLHIHTVANENAFITRGNHGYVLPDADVSDYENLSVVFDAFYLGTNNNPRAFIGFNVESNGQRWLEASTSANFFAWYTTEAENDHKHRYNITYTDASSNTANINSSTEAPDFPYSGGLADGKNTVEYTDTDTTSQNTRGTAVVSENTEPNLSYTVDKMGDVGVLSINSQLVDVWNTAEIFSSNSALSGKTAPKTGYVYLASAGDGYNSAMYIKDWKLVTSTLREYAHGPFNVTDIFANEDTMTVTFDKNVEGADITRVSVTDKNGTTVQCEKDITEDKLIITPYNGFVLDEIYNISITDKFGYDAVLLEKAYNKSFRVNKIKEITFDDGETYIDNDIDIRSYQGYPAATVRNGKLYVQDAYYSTIYIRNAVTDVENYHVNFDMQRYAIPWYNTTHIMFNVGDKASIFNYGNGLEGFGWRFRENNSTIYKEYRHLKHKTGSDTYRTAVSGGFIPKASATDVTFTENAEKGDFDVTLPATDAVAYNVQLDKEGTKGILSIDGSYIDTYETKDVYKDWNLMPANSGAQLESQVVPSTGDLLITGYNNGGATIGTIAIGTITFTTFELVEEEIKLSATFLDKDNAPLKEITGAETVKGVVTAESTYNTQKPLTLVALAYAGNTMLASEVLEVENNIIEASGKTLAPYSFTGLEGLTDIKFLALESLATLKPYAKPGIFTGYTEPEEINDEPVYMFVGDSITHADVYPSLVESYFITRFPYECITFENAGQSGGSGSTALKRYFYDIGNKDVDKAIIMLGMNDVGRSSWPLGPEDSGYQEQFNNNVGKIESCINNVTEVTKKLMAKDTSVALMTPSVYDTRDYSTSVNYKGVNSALTEIGAREIAKASEMGIDTIDLNTTMNIINNNVLTSGKEEMIRSDRIHPNNYGAYVIASEVINYWFKNSGLVASVNINSSDSSVTAKNSTVENVVISENGVTYSYKPNSLPWYCGSDYKTVEERGYVNLTEDLNREIIKVSGLEEDTVYKISFDGVEITTATGKELASGINIATLEKNPGQAAAKLVHEYISAKSSNVYSIRNHYLSYTNDEIMVLDEEMIAVKNKENRSYVAEARKAAQPKTYLVTIVK